MTGEQSRDRRHKGICILSNVLSCRNKRADVPLQYTAKTGVSSHRYWGVQLFMCISIYMRIYIYIYDISYIALESITINWDFSCKY